MKDFDKKAAAGASACAWFPEAQLTRLSKVMYADWISASSIEELVYNWH